MNEWTDLIEPMLVISCVALLSYFMYIIIINA